MNRTSRHAECETPFIVVRIVQSDETSLFATGLYRDTFELDGSERLLLKQRVVVCDSNRIDTLLAVPL
jgi:hypothetical protein